MRNEYYKGRNMIRAKKIFMRLLLIAEMTVFGHLYFFGNNGISVLQKQRAVVCDMQKNITTLKEEIGQLEQEIYVWQTDDFYKEKVD